MPLNLVSSISATNTVQSMTAPDNSASGSDKWQNPNRAKASAGGWKSTGCVLQ
jgi:hypothetical protein